MKTIITNLTLNNEGNFDIEIAQLNKSDNTYTVAEGIVEVEMEETKGIPMNNIDEAMVQLEKIIDNKIGLYPMAVQVFDTELEAIEYYNKECLKLYA